MAALPDEVGRMTALRELSLRGNRLTSLPLSMAGLRSLRTLDLRANALNTVPEWLAELPSLQKLDLRWNPIRGHSQLTSALESRGCSVYLDSA
jgi:Leucine-rich repeat (LRR) protein